MNINCKEFFLLFQPISQKDWQELGIGDYCDSASNILRNTEPAQKILGGPAIRHYHILNDKRHVLTKDTEENVALYDVLKACKIEDLGRVDFEQECKKRNKMVYVPNWFNVDLKTGVCVRFFDDSVAPEN
jgi:WD repeat-containing protein 48